MKTQKYSNSGSAITEALHGKIAEALAPLPVPEDRVQLLRQRLAARVAQSAERHRGVRIFRREDVRWQVLAKGVRACVLHDNGATRSALVDFAPGSRLPSHRHAAHEECIVLRGSLEAGDCHVGLHDYHLAPAGSRHSGIESREGGLAFLRGTSIGKTSDMMREMLGAWLPGSRERPGTISASAGEWREMADGASMKLLWRLGNEASMLLRLRAGARVPAYVHHVAEECLLLDGEAFFGDILLRESEYQMVPPGLTQGDAFSDVGALLYVHGDAAYVHVA